MRRRVHIATLVYAVVFVGVALAALRSSSQLWAGVCFTAALGSLPLAAVHLIYSRRRRRAYWAGFLLVGSTYFLATLSPWLGDEIGPRLVTLGLIDLSYPYITPPSDVTPPQTEAMTTAIRKLNAQVVYVNALNQALRGLPPRTINLNAVIGPSPAEFWAAWTTPDRTDGVGIQAGRIRLASTTPYRRIGQSLLTLAFAHLGGLYARRRFDRLATRAD